MDIFSIDPEPTFTAPVWLPLPGKAPVKVTFRFRHMEHEAFYAMLAESSAAREKSADFLARFVDGWEGDAINAPFSRESPTRATPRR